MAAEPIAVYVAYGADGIITGASLADTSDAQSWIREAAGRTIELIVTTMPIRIGMRRAELVTQHKQQVWP